MNGFISLLERWWRPLLFVAWVWELSGLLRRGLYTNFLRPEFGYVLGLGLFTLLGFLITGMSDTRERKFGTEETLHVLVLLLPLVYLCNAKGASLDVYSFKNRSLGVPTVSAGGAIEVGDGMSSVMAPFSEGDSPLAPDDMSAGMAQEKEARDSVQNRVAVAKAAPVALPDPDVTGTGVSSAKEQNGDVASVDDMAAEEEAADAPARTVDAADKPQAVITKPKPAPKPKSNPKPAGPAKKVTLVDLYCSPKLFVGKRVKLIGMLHKNDKFVEKDFGKKLLVVFRFVITCCAADASPAAVLVDGKNLADLPENSWVEVEGKYLLEKKQGRTVPMLYNSGIRQIEAPKQPYLY